MNRNSQQLSWFGKLPCVGDFCSHNMPAGLQEMLDQWISVAMQEGEAAYGDAWKDAYFQTPIHGFVWGPQVTRHLNNQVAIGIMMPSVDKAGRAFPFILLQPLPTCSMEILTFESLMQWFQQAHTLCADALNEEWCLSKLELKSECLSMWTKQSASSDLIQLSSTQSQWFRIEYNGVIMAAFQCEGSPASHHFNALLGLRKT